uniref:Uncharacterized protein n=1 Tax=Oryza brachyantha TaxID=4533 RepID=J3L752_ORYBR
MFATGTASAKPESSVMASEYLHCSSGQHSLLRNMACLQCMCLCSSLLLVLLFTNRNSMYMYEANQTVWRQKV